MGQKNGFSSYEQGGTESVGGDGAISEKRIRQKVAGEILGASARQLKGLLRAYRRVGAAGLVSKQSGRRSQHPLAPEKVQVALDLLKGRYADCGPISAHKKMVERDGLKLSLGSVRKVMI